MTFRVHLSDGTKHDVDADNPEEAGKVATRKAGMNVFVLKVKRVRENR